MERFLRTSRLIGEENQRKLHDTHVTVVGLGAVGSYALEALARSGVGHLRVVDFDTVGLTNINRQLFALDTTLGRPKCDVACERITQINPECKVESMRLFAEEQTLDTILSGRVDLLIDGIDSLNPKLTLLTEAWQRSIPTFSSMGAALRKDPFAIQAADVYDTHTCPLARQVRKKLRRRGVDRGITAVFSTENIDFEYREPEDEAQSDFNEQIIDKGRERRVLGSMPTITGIFGLTIAQLAVNRLLSG
jgi:tRNA A37 threonylcarbamoyladenosine dehydratase